MHRSRVIASHAGCHRGRAHSTTEEVIMSTAVPDVIVRYFELDAARDVEGVLRLFADDATVVDEGATWQGADAIRAWRLGPVSKYTYRTEVAGTDAVAPDRYVVAGRLTGDFPGGSADPRWDFTVAGDRVTRLVIAP